MKERISNDFCELLEDEVEKITKKGDISPSEMDNAYKAIKSVYYLTVLDEMKEAKERGYDAYSRRGGDGYSGGYSYRDDMSMDGMSNRGSYDGSYGRGSYDGQSNAGRGRDGDGDGRYSEDYSGRRGRDAMGRYTSRNDGSYDNYSREDEKEQLKRSIEDMKRKLEHMN